MNVHPDLMLRFTRDTLDALHDQRRRDGIARAVAFAARPRDLLSFRWMPSVARGASRARVGPTTDGVCCPSGA